MDAIKLGVVTPNEGEGAKDGAGAGQEGVITPKESEGTGGAAETPAEKKPEEGAGAEGAGEGAGNEGEGDPKDKRINDLMSMWQSEGSDHNKTKTKLQLYEEKFGSLDGEGKPAPTAKPKVVPDISADDADLPDALKPGWSPQTIAELQEGLKQSALYGAQLADKNITQRTQTTEQARVEAEQQLDTFVAEIKKVDTEFDDKVFFQYATEHGFPVSSIRDLRAVYSSYVSLERAKRGAVDQALKNKDGRKNPVGKPGSGQGGNGAIPFSKIQQSTSAKDLISDMINNRK